VGSTQAGDPVVVGEGPPASTELLVGTDSVQNGLYAWQLEGGLPVQLLSLGVLRSADWQPGLLVVASANGVLLFYEVTASGLVARDPAAFNAVSPGVVSLIPAADAGYEAWYDTSSEVIDHVAIAVEGDGGLVITQGPSLTVPQVPAGLAADERTGRLYVSQPTLGLLAVERDGGSRLLVSIDAGTLGPLVGGVSLFHAADGGVFVFTTSPSTDTVQVHGVGGTQVSYRGSFSIGEPDGGAVRVRAPRFLDVHEQPLTGFPQGALLVQDGVLGNYKLVDLAAVDPLVGLPTAAGQVVSGPDAGAAPDGGVDGGGALGVGGGGRGGNTGGTGGSTQPPLTEGCSCTSGPFALLPVMLLLWWIRRFRS
jgi:uncharacterized protein (TIGR03382 family)